MKDYNTITADLLKNATHGIDCYVSNASYAEALHDIHCTGDAVKRITDCGSTSGWFYDTACKAHVYVIPVHLVVEQLAQATNEVLDLRTHMTVPSVPLLQREGN